MEYGSRWFDGAAVRHPDRIAFSDRSTRVTWLDLLDRAGRSAVALERAAGQVVAIELPASVDWVVALFAIWQAGAVAMPIDSRLDAETAGERRRNAFAVVDRPLPLAEAPLVPAEHDPLSPALLLHTSGTTGRSGEVLLSHSNLAAQGVASREALQGGPDDVWLGVLPLTHMGGIGMVIRNTVWSSREILMERFDAAEVATVLGSDESEVTLVSLVPTMLRRLLDAGLRSPPGLRRAIVSGAPLPGELKDRALAAGIPVVESWGMTETTGMASVERSPAAGGAGTALPGVHLETSPDGEIRVGGPTVAPGVTVGGMLDSGDLGTVEEGTLTVEGRLSTRIISGGEKVSPERVESVLLESGLLRDCLVRGEADLDWGEVVVAEVVPGDSFDAARLERHCSGLLAPWEVPKRFIVVDAIETGIAGKPLRASRGRR